MLLLREMSVEKGNPFPFPEPLFPYCAMRMAVLNCDVIKMPSQRVEM